MNRLRVGFALVALLAIATTAPPLVAQGGVGRLEGRVRTEEGAPLHHARVIVVGTPLAATTDSAGHYAIAEVPAGALAIRVVLIGYKRSQVEGVRLAAGQTITQDFALAPSSTAMTNGTVRPTTSINAVAVNGIEDASIWTRVRVEGCVRTETGVPVRAAHLEFIGLNRSAATDTTGYYALDSVPAGVLAIRVRAGGFRPALVEGLRVGGPRMLRQDFVMTVATAGEGTEPTKTEPSARLLYRGTGTASRTTTVRPQPGVTVNPRTDRLGEGVRSDAENTYIDGVPFQTGPRSLTMRSLSCTR